MDSHPTPPTAAGPATDWLALDQQLCFALYASSLAMTKLYKPLLEPLGLTYPQYLVMLALWEQDGLSVSELGHRLSLDSGTLTPLLKRLQTQGLLQRQRDPTDERRVRLQLSDAGRALRQQAVNVPRAVACSLAGGPASRADLNEISELTQRLHGLRQRLTQAFDA